MHKKLGLRLWWNLLLLAVLGLNPAATVFAPLRVSASPLALAQSQNIYQTDILGPAGSSSFGKHVVVLANGNIVVADPDYDTDSATNVGAVYLYDGETLALISMLTGSNTNDQVGLGYGGVDDVTALSNGNFVVSSPNWNSYAGAVTWVSGVTGISGAVSADNSLVGETNDLVGAEVFALDNGNYVVLSPFWDNHVSFAENAGAATWANGATGISGSVSAANSFVGGEYQSFVGSGVRLLSNGNFLVMSLNAGKGAVTWGSAVTGITGTLSAANSLVGSHYGDQVGNSYGSVEAVVPLTNGNYVIVTPSWDNGAAVDAGAVTWGNGATGVTGIISIANSLVGTRLNDNVGNGGNAPGVTPLSNGNYVVTSYIWDRPAVADVGAVTWGNGATGIHGAISPANSLVGAQTQDYVGFIPNCSCSGVTALSNGNYVVSSPSWSSGFGAATWANGATGVTGAISSANSLVGDATSDNVGLRGATALPNGNYLVRSPEWHGSSGAVTWGNGATGVTGVVSVTNSLVGGSRGDYVGWDGVVFPNKGLTVLSNGNYVVSSPYWQKTWLSETGVGAVTWGNGATGTTGAVSAANSLVGSSSNDKIGSLGDDNPNSGVVALSNDNYVVASRYWDNGAAADAGAVTWASGDSGIQGTISAANSLVGNNSNDLVGINGVMALTNGNYVVASPNWNNMPAGKAEVGAVTWGDGDSGITGAVSPANSLVGSSEYDPIGTGGVTALANGNYVVHSPTWDNGAIPDAGAVTWGSGDSGIQGTISAANSLVGSSEYDSVGSEAVTVLSNGDYLVHSPLYDNATAADAGAVTWGFGVSGTAGLISSGNSVLGTTSNQGNTMTFQAANNNLRIIIGRDIDQIVTVVELVPRLVVSLAGEGSGSVSSTPAGIACGDDCTETFSHGTLVTLIAAPALGSTFTGWTGACTGMGECTVTMDGARAVTATFAANTYALTVTRAGDGSGSVSSDPAGIACGDDCTETFSHGTLVTLTAVLATGSTFTGWTGACTGAGECTVTIDGAKTITATFTKVSIMQLFLPLITTP